MEDPELTTRAILSVILFDLTILVKGGREGEREGGREGGREGRREQRDYSIRYH